jgi:NAD(P)H dehydrogenase (quinone)
VGLLPGKKVFIINTLGASLSAYEQIGAFKGMELLMDGEIFRFCGLEVTGHKYFGSVPTVADEDRKKMLEEVAGIAASWPAK